MEYDVEDILEDDFADTSELAELFADDVETLVALKIKRSD